MTGSCEIRHSEGRGKNVRDIDNHNFTRKRSNWAKIAPNQTFSKY